MEKLVRIALAALFLLGIASAQNVPAINVFGGFSYLSFNVPANTYTTFASGDAVRLGLEGWEFSGSVNVFHRIAVEGDLSGHSLSNCGGTVSNCSNFAFMGGPRFTLGDRSKRITGFVHGLVGRDRMDLPLSQASDNGVPVSDTSFAFAGGGGLDYWIFRSVGIQLGPVDYIYTHHLSADNVPSQGSFRAAGGVVFRFGGPAASTEPKPSSEPSPRSRRARRQGQPTSTVAAQQPAQPAGVVVIPGRGLSIPALGALFAPQEFDGAKIVEIAPGSVAQMASLKPGDLIRSVDGKTIKTPMELAAELSDKTGKVRIGILRGDTATETLVLLGH